VNADTLCVHGDHPNAVSIARAIRFRLAQLGYCAHRLTP
jgi:lactam utilization protein B